MLTTPVLRALRLQLGAEVHCIVKSGFREVLANNPHVTRIFHFENSFALLVPELKKEKYDLVVDLHKNFRSFRLRLALGVKSLTFDKLNYRKFLAVRLKMRWLLPPVHIVDRYFSGLARTGISNDGAGLEYFIGGKDQVDTAALFFKGQPKKFIALVIGGSYFTKKIPFNKLVQICDRARLPLVLLGGPGDKPVADELRKMFPHLINGSGQFNISQSASVISQAEWVITSDTGLMHIAAAFNRKIISAWGNTIPEFGMAPYQPQPENKILQVELSCRPCSKLGYNRCPRRHFKCMQNIDYEFVRDLK